MGEKHFTEEQIAFALRQAESGTSGRDTMHSPVVSVLPHNVTFQHRRGPSELRKLPTLL